MTAIKFKFINEKELAVKLKCGGYLLVDRLGLYFNELSLNSKFGFTMITSSN